MNEFTYYIQVKFVSDQCLGKDLAQLLEIIPNLNNGMWYLFDIETNSFDNGFAEIQNKMNKQELINYSRSIDQYFSGVFLYFSDRCIVNKNIVIEAEDEKYRNPLNASFEIRAFDTTYFEIFSFEYQLVNLIMKKLKQQKISYDFESNI